MLDEIQPLPEPEPEPPRPRPWALLLATTSLSAAAIGFYLMLQGAVLAFIPTLLRPGSYGLAFTLSTLVSVPLGILLLLGLTRLRPSVPVRDYLGLRLPTLRQALLALALLAVFNLVYDQLTRFLNRPLVPDFMLDVYRTAHGLPALYLAVVVAAPAFEEMLFRGFLLPGLTPALGGLGAALVSSALFGLLHLQYDLFDMTAVFLLGLLFAGVRLKTGSILLTFTLHAITNLIATLEVAWVLAHASGHG